MIKEQWDDNIIGRNSERLVYEKIDEIIEEESEDEESYESEIGSQETNYYIDGETGESEEQDENQEDDEIEEKSNSY